MARSTIAFSVYLNGKLINEVRFDRPIINVGKLSTSTLRLDDINVSRKHAVIEQREDGKWRVTDLGSTNGTVLRGERVVQSELKDGDRLALGTTTLVVHLDEGEAARAAPLVTRSGVAGDPPAVPAASALKATKPEEIRGLGAASFYQKKAGAAGSAWVLDVALLWGETVLASKTFHKAGDVTFAEQEPADFVVPREVIGSPSFALATGHGNGWALDLSNPNVTGDVLLGDKVRAVEELAAEQRTLPISGPLRARFKLGEFTVLLSHAPVVTAKAMKREVEKEPMLFLGVSAVVQLALLIVAQTAPDDLLMSTRDPRAERQKVIQALKITPIQLEEETKQEAAREIDKERVASEREAQDLELDPKEIAPVAEPTPVPERDPLVDKVRRHRPPEDLTKLTPEQRQERANKLAQQTALAEAFRANNPLFDKLMTNPDLDAKPSPFKSLGLNDPNASGTPGDSGNINPFSGFNATSGGFLPSEGGPPPGDPDSGPVIPGLKKDPTRDDLGPVKFKDDPREPEVIEKPARISGELDEKTVQQHIRRYLSGIKWCYQDRLQANPKLGGKVTLAFTIMPDGHTHEPRTARSSLGDATLEQCIATKMERWRFPQPKDGGVVEVAYPLILKTQ